MLHSAWSRSSSVLSSASVACRDGQRNRRAPSTCAPSATCEPSRSELDSLPWWPEASPDSTGGLAMRN
eukprot:15438881-Alexandrium_andersonii.AAC.1